MYLSLCNVSCLGVQLRDKLDTGTGIELRG